MGSQAELLRIFQTSILAGTWVNTALYTLELALCAVNIPKWRLNRVFKLLFTAMLINDAFGVAVLYANAIQDTLGTLSVTDWPVRALLVSSVVSADLEQCYLIFRYWKVSHASFFAAFLLTLSVTHTLIALTSIGVIQPVTDKWSLTTIAGVVCTVEDALIAFATIWTLSGINPVWRSTQNLIRAVCLNALASGVVVATVTILAVLPVFVNGGARYVLNIFFASMGRVYSLTVIFNFIHRRAQHQAHAFANSLHIPPTEAMPSAGGVPVSVVVGSTLFRSDIHPHPPSEPEEDADGSPFDTSTKDDLESAATSPVEGDETTRLPLVVLHRDAEQSSRRASESTPSRVISNAPSNPSVPILPDG
uniref:Transmembrane protein n=1 Tax=Mycena chlorophos TaxID=658473 RepID=A0ABQ0M7X6_MYCCL|nr:predicted protein [Mycena chlorophos]